MNKLRYRIVFNKTRGMCMAVQETARSRTKGAGQGVVDSSLPSAMRLPALRRMPFLLAIGVGGVIFGGNVLAQIVADPRAPGQQQATVLNAANGVLQVNIQTPSTAGVSRNVYSKFDVPTTGAVINNSRSNVQTQLGGWVQGNPWLSKGTARVILNEVNSSDPSRLQGYIEVAGDRAETIIANPAGIVVDGGGFINVSRATLTTGIPTIEDGFLKGYSVQRGQIVIDGAGLNASKTDYTALIARSLQVNAGLWAQRLTVITGVNQVEEATQATVSQTGQATGAPLFAVDVARFGGMYANQIYLVGTETGVGVRNAGEIGAVAGDLVVTADGRLENSGTLQASQRLKVTTRDVDNLGAMQARETLTLTTENLRNAGRIIAGVEAQIKAEGDITNDGGRVEASRIDIAGATLHNDHGSIVQTGASALAIEASQVINAAGMLGQKNVSGDGDMAESSGSAPSPLNAGDASGGSGSASGQPSGDAPVVSGPTPVLADGRLTFKSIDNTAGAIASNGPVSLRTEELDSRGGQAYLDSLSVIGTSFDNTGGTLTVLRSFTARIDSFVNDQGKLLVGAAFDGGLGAFSNREGTLQAGQLAVNVKRYLDNSGGTLRQLGGTTADISVGGELALDRGALETAASLKLRAGSISGSASTLNVTGDLALESGATSATKATWLIGGSASLRTGALDNGDGKIATGGALSVDSVALNNAGGTVAAGTDVAINAADGIDNSRGIIQAGRDLKVAASGALDNHAGDIETLSGGSTMNVASTTIDNREGRIANAGIGKTTLEAVTVTNSGVIGGNGDVEIVARRLINEATGSIVSQDNMDMSVRGALDNSGRINVGGDFRMAENSAQLSNHGTLVALGDIEIAVSAIDNTSGQLATMAGGRGKMALRAASLVNRDGLIDADNHAHIEIQGGINNERGHVRVGGELALNASDRIENRGGTIETAGRMQVHGGEIGNDEGMIVAAGTQASAIEADRGIDNNGLIGANGRLAVMAETFSNGTHATLSATGDLDLAVHGRLVNDGGTISTAGALNFDEAHAALVNSGIITAASNARLSIDHFNNDGGTISTLGGANLGVTANGLSNRGGRVMAGANASVLIKGDIDNDAGVLQSAGSLDVGAGGSLNNRGGVIEVLDTHGTLAMRAAAINNTDGSIVNVGDGAASVSATGHIDNSGLIGGNGQLEVAAATMNNTGIVTSASKIELGVGSALNNIGMISAAAGLHTDQGGATLRNSGTIVAGGPVEMTVKAVDNTGGAIATAQGSNADMLLNARNVSNQSGAIMSDRNAALQVTDGFDNRSGLVQAKGELQLSTGGGLDTSGGSIETLSKDSALQLRAGAVLNDAGRIVNAGSGGTQVHADTSLVNNGQIAGNGLVGLEAQTIVNQAHGSIGGAALALQAHTSMENAGDVSSRSTLTVDATGAALSNHGSFVANGDITMHAAAIDNDSGTVAAVGGSGASVALEGTSVSNRSGRILADRALSLDVDGALDNDRGLLQAGIAVHATIGGKLGNDGGAIEVTDPGASLALQAIAIDNGSGRIVNVGHGSTTVAAVDSLKNGGLIGGNGGLDLRAASLSNLAAGTLASGGAMTATIGSYIENAGAINSGATLDIGAQAAAVHNTGLVMAGGAMTVTSASFDNDGGQLATAKDSGADLLVSATSISNRSGAILSDRDVRITSADAFDNTKGTLQAAGSLQLAAAGAAGNDGGVIETIDPSASLKLHAGSLNNGTGRIVNVGIGATTVAVDGNLSSTGLIAGNGSVDVASAGIENQAGGSIVSGTTLNITTTRSLGNAGTISSTATLRIDAAGAAVRNSGQIVSGDSATLDTGAFDNNGGQLATVRDRGGDIVLHASDIANVSGMIVADGAAEITSGAGFDNRQGTVRANDAVGIDALGALGNQGGAVEAAGAAATLGMRARSIDNSAGRLVNVGSGASHVTATAGIVNSGILAGNGSVNLSAAAVENLAAGTITAGSDLNLQVSQLLGNAGTVSAARALSMDESGAQVVNSGRIVAADGIALHGASISNDGGQIATQSGKIVLSSESTLSNRSGVIAAAGNAILNAQGAYDNGLGQVQTSGRLQINAGGSLANTGGALEAVGASSTLAVQAASIDNTAGRIVNAGSGTTIIDSTAAIVNSGTIAGNGAFTLSAQTLQNARAGVLGSGETMELAARERLTNAGTIGSSANLHFDQEAASFSNSGQIGAAGAIEIASATLTNRGGQLYTANNSNAAISLRTGSLDNTGGVVSSDGNLRAAVSGSVSNGEGVLHGGAGTILDVDGQLVNGSGIIETAASALALQARSVESSGRIVNGGMGSTTIASTTDIVNSGTIAGNGALAISAQSLQNRASGMIGTGTTLDLAVREQLDNAGSISSGGILRFDQMLARFGNSGRIGAGGRIDITSADFSNHGQLYTVSGSEAAIDLHTATLDNSSGIVSADGALAAEIGGSANNGGGTLHGGSSTTLGIGGALANGSGTIESASGALAIQAQSVDSSGRIVNAGNGATSISTSGAVVNNGIIGGNSTFDLHALTLSNRESGQILSGGAIELGVTQRLDNAGTMSSGGSIHFDQRAADFTNGGRIGAGGSIDITAATLGNRGGQLYTANGSGAAINLQTGSLDNTGGTLSADSLLQTDVAGSVANGSGTLHGGTGAALYAGGTLNNGSGTIETAAGMLQVRAQSIGSSGRIVNAGVGPTIVESTTGIVNSGTIAGNGALDLHAAMLQNLAGGQIASGGALQLDVRQQLANAGRITSGGTLVFDQAGASFLNQGQLAAAGNIELATASFDNSGGQVSTVHGSNANITVVTSGLNNRDGAILADGSAALLLANDVDNTRGMLQAGGDLALTTSGIITNGGGAIETLGATSSLTLRGAAIDNGNGRISNAGIGDTRLVSQTSITNAGIIAGMGNLFLSGETLSNQEGATVASGGSLALEIARQVSNSGKINSGGTLTFDQAGATFRNSGEVYSGGDAVVNVSLLNNDGGRLGTGSGSGADLTLTSQQLSNQGGRIATDRDLIVKTATFNTLGELFAGRDLSLTMDGDYVQVAGGQQLRSNRNLSLTVSGNITNAAALEAAGVLSLSSQQINNQSGASIAGNGVILKASGDLTNAGEINGASLVDITAANVSNSGGIVGGYVTVATGNLNNSSSSALIGATDILGLGVTGTLNNTGGATLYSGGDMLLGGRDGGSAVAVNNISSTIEAAGSLALNASSLSNVRENVQIVKVKTVDETVHMSMPSWYQYGDNHNSFETSAANYSPHEVYFVSPSDILEDQVYVTPDGFTIHRAVIRTRANDSAFYVAASGLFGSYGQQTRLTLSEGTRVIYYTEADLVANPDQGAPESNVLVYSNSGVTHWSGTVSFSNQYGNCSSDCIRLVTQPGYVDPSSTILRDTMRALAPVKEQLEVSRDAHHTVVEDQLAPGAGASAQILAGGNMYLNVSSTFENRFGQIKAGGVLAVVGGATRTNVGATMYRTHTFDGTWRTYGGQTVSYQQPTMSEAIGLAAGIIEGGQGVSISGRSFSNVDITAGAVGNIRDAINVIGSGFAGGSSVGSHVTANAGAGAYIGGYIAAGGGMDGSAGVRVSADAGTSAASNGQVSGSTVGTQVDLAASVAATGSNGGLSPVEGAVASGQTNKLHAGSLMNDSGYANDAAASGGVSTSGTNNSLAANGAVAQSGATSNGHLSGAIISAQNQSHLGNIVIGAGKSASQQAGSVQATEAGGVTKFSPSGLFIRNPDTSGSYLYETRPQFANQQQWISSDYLLKQLAYDPATTQKRLGDGFYEQRLVREQLAELTGHTSYSGASDDSTYQQLLTNAVSVAREFGLRPGVALSADQVRHLTSDIVWMESQNVMLPDGSVETVLVPKVYLAHVGKQALQPGGALVTGKGVMIDTMESIVNSGGVINGGNGRTLLVAGQDIVNRGGSIKGDSVALVADHDVRNESLAVTEKYDFGQNGGSYTSLSNVAAITATGTLDIMAGRDLSDVAGRITAGSASLTAGRNIDIDTIRTGSTYQSQIGGYTEKDSSITHQLSQVSAGGDLKIAATGNLDLNGTQVAIGTAGSGTGQLLAGGTINVAAVTNEINTSVQNDPSSKQYDKQVHQNQMLVGAGVAATGGLTVGAGILEKGGINITASSITAGDAVKFTASDSVNIVSAQERHLSDTALTRTSSSFMKSKTTQQADYVASSQAIGSTISGKTVDVSAGKDINVLGSAIAGDGDVSLAAVGSVNIGASTSTLTEQHHSQVKESGFLSGNGFSFSIGTRTTTTDQSRDATTQSGQSRSMVGSLGGNLSIVAGDAVKVSGSDLAAGMNMTLDGRSVTIDPGLDKSKSKFEQTTVQDGLTFAIGGSVVNAISTVQGMNSAASQSKDGRVQALAAATAGLAVKDAATDIAKNGLNLSVSLTVGHSESKYTQTASDLLNSGSVLNAGRDIIIRASGGDKDSNINVIGSDLIAKGNVTLKADNQVNLLAAQDQQSQHSESKAMSAAAGLGASIGTKGTSVGLTASASASRGNTDGEGATQVNTHVTAGNQLTIASGGDTNLKGAVASGNQVVANIGGNLNIESLHDKATFDSKNQGVSVGATAGVGVSVSGSVNQGTMHNDYASVQEQSSIRAGDGGFQVTVGGNTDLKGGVISSSAAGSETSSLVTGTLTSSDIANHATSSGSMAGMGGGFTVAGNGGAATGKEDGGIKLKNLGSSGVGGSLPSVSTVANNATGVTHSGIGGGTLVLTDDVAQRGVTGQGAAQAVAGINRDVVTGRDTSGRIANNFNPDAMHAELAVTSAFTAAAAPLAANVVGDIGKTKQDSAQREADAYGLLAADAVKRGDSAEAKILDTKASEAQAVADSWGDNGINRVTLHVAAQGLIGGLSAGSTGAVTSVSGVVGGNLGRQLGQNLGEAEADRQGLQGDARKDLINTYQNTIATIGGAVVGLTTSSSSGTGGQSGLVGAIQAAGTAHGVDSFNRQLHPEEKQRIKQLANGDPVKEARLTAAACAAVKCYAEFPVDSEAYKKLKQIAEIGSSPALLAEREQLAQVQDLFGYTTTGVFSDKNKDAAKQLNNTYRISIRALGAGQTIMGGLGVAASVVTAPASCATVIGCAANAGVGTLSLDAMYAGAKQVTSGDPEATFTNKALQTLGLSPEAAGWMEAAVGIGAAAKAASVAGKAVEQSIVFNKTSAVTYLQKGARPDPATYLSREQIDSHLANFEKGGAYLVPKDVLDKYGRDVLGYSDNSQFIMTKGQMDQLLTRANGNVAVLERELGIPSGTWQGKEVVRIDIPDPSSLRLRMPSGNEAGANELWVPGGKLPTGQLEAIVNSIPKGKYIERRAWDPKR